MTAVPPPPPTTETKTESGLVVPPNDMNPGTFEELHRKTKDIFPMSFEGARFVFQKGLNSYFQINQTLVMSALQPSGYKLGCTYVGGYRCGPTESYPVMMGEIDLSGNFSANVIHQFSKYIRCKLQVQNHKWLAFQITADYKGTDHVSSLTLRKVDPIRDSGLVVVQYLQSITRRLVFGAEFIHQRHSNFPDVSLGSRYSGDAWQVSGSFTAISGPLNLCYCLKANENLQIGIELDGSHQSQEFTLTVGCQLDLPKADLVFKGQLDSNFCISATMEKKLQSLPLLFTLRGCANHVKGVYRFGIGLTVG